MPTRPPRSDIQANRTGKKKKNLLASASQSDSSSDTSGSTEESLPVQDSNILLIPVLAENANLEDYKEVKCSSGRDVPTEIVVCKPQITRLGKQYAVMEKLWASDKIFKTRQPKNINPKNRTAVPELILLLKFNPKDKAYPLFAPVLFLLLKQDMKKVFKTPVLARVLKIILLGPSSLEGNTQGQPKSNAQLWGVTHITPGSIACEAMLDYNKNNTHLCLHLQRVKGTMSLRSTSARDYSR
ncbi:hypothetical protein SERLA73DRAFT_150581 [Serpula lacrymans var. lacrymans S7.3]|uniref:Uncharacterized protein n=1 Tax=Serpula lacrymans var. lacrymans (strain S7.3) TaxID=936435 RepID=F8PN78_SERL3|nr:hypothetical protein SERLA73DRAFT_150581 [Serpula lacrymans var. lacrymans S7.3]